MIEVIRKEEVDQLRLERAELEFRARQRALLIVKLHREIKRTKGIADDAISALHLAHYPEEIPWET